MVAQPKFNQIPSPRSMTQKYTRRRIFFTPFAQGLRSVLGSCLASFHGLVLYVRTCSASFGTLSLHCGFFRVRSGHSVVHCHALSAFCVRGGFVFVPRVRVSASASSSSAPSSFARVKRRRPTQEKTRRQTDKDKSRTRTPQPNAPTMKIMRLAPPIALI